MQMLWNNLRIYEVKENTFIKTLVFNWECSEMNIRFDIYSIHDKGFEPFCKWENRWHATPKEEQARLIAADARLIISEEMSYP
jgi:hypothetical protein